VPVLLAFAMRRLGSPLPWAGSAISGVSVEMGGLLNQRREHRIRVQQRLRYAFHAARCCLGGRMDSPAPVTNERQPGVPFSIHETSMCDLRIARWMSTVYAAVIPRGTRWVRERWHIGFESTSCFLFPSSFPTPDSLPLD
jgi:hypothetical protein